MDTRLKSKKVIDSLFVSGTSVFCYPIKLVYIEQTLTENNRSFHAGVSVSKRSFKKAVDRNKIKRRLREAIRLDLTPHMLDMNEKSIAGLFIYVAKEELEYLQIAKAIKVIKKKLLKATV